MKKYFLSALTLLLVICANAQFSKATLQATGLTCAMCSNAINKALLEVPFIETVKPDIPNSAFEIVFKENVPVEIDALKAAVEDAGFSIGNLRLTGSFNSVAIANDQHLKIGEANFHFVDVKSQTLNGVKTIQVIDKNFMTEKQFKKMSSLTKKNCIKTGMSESCCTAQGIPASARIYHVTII